MKEVFTDTERNKVRKYFILSLDIYIRVVYNNQAIGVWRSLVSRLVRDQEASGSNPDTPTKTRKTLETQRFQAFFF